MAWSEVFTSLQTGVLNGGDNVLRNLVDFKLYEIEKYVTITQQMLEIVPLTVGERFFQGQPVKIREALLKAASDAWAWEFFAMAEDDLKIKEKLRELGMVVDEPDITPWRKARDTWPQFYDKSGGKDLFDKVISIIKK
jgi:TRAP-type C4-dicarboxylate transport system substrate-binding protein